MTHSKKISELREAIAFFNNYDYENAHLVKSLHIAAKAHLTLLEAIEAGTWKIVPVEPNKEMLISTDYSMRNVASCIVIADVHGCGLAWDDENPPLYHAYKAMIENSPDYLWNLTKGDE